MPSMWLIPTCAVVALVAGLGCGIWLVRNFEWVSDSAASAPDIEIEDMEPLIRDAAERWAAAYGRPEAAGLVAGKLRTLHAIRYGSPTTPIRRRWWQW